MAQILDIGVLIVSSTSNRQWRKATVESGRRFEIPSISTFDLLRVLSVHRIDTPFCKKAIVWHTNVANADSPLAMESYVVSNAGGGNMEPWGVGIGYWWMVLHDACGLQWRQSSCTASTAQ